MRDLAVLFLHLLVTVAYARRDLLSPVLRGRAPRPETVLRRLRAFFAFLRLLPPILGDRRRTRRNRRMSDADVMHWLDRDDGEAGRDEGQHRLKGSIA